MERFAGRVLCFVFADCFLEVRKGFQGDDFRVGPLWGYTVEWRSNERDRRRSTN